MNLTITLWSTFCKLQFWLIHLQGTEIRGQMFHVEERDCLLFMGSPNLQKLDELKCTGIYISDIPIHDATRDVILVGEQAKAQESLKRRLDKLRWNFFSLSVINKWLCNVGGDKWSFSLLNLKYFILFCKIQDLNMYFEIWHSHYPTLLATELMPCWDVKDVFAMPFQISIFEQIDWCQTTFFIKYRSWRHNGRIIKQETYRSLDLTPFNFFKNALTRKLERTSFFRFIKTGPQILKARQRKAHIWHIRVSQSSIKK